MIGACLPEKPDGATMNPELSLGPWDAPSFEMHHSDVRAIVALLLEAHAPLDQEDTQYIWTLLTLDSVHLHSDSSSFFLKFADICTHICEGHLSHYDPEKLRTTEFAACFKGGVGDGAVTEAVVGTARGFLAFLKEHPDRWPWRPDAAARA
jgi:hypothetical protein